MQHKWLAFLTVGFFAAIVFTFFVISLRPVEIPSASGSDAPEGISEPSVTFVNPSRGPSDAEVTIIEYADFQCTHCATLAASIDTAFAQFPGKIRLVWKNLPNDAAHPQATNAAVAAHCAARQANFWEYHDALFERAHFLSEGQYGQIAEDLGLDAEAFGNCYDARETQPVVERDAEEARALGIAATPSLYIDGELFVGAMTTEELMLYVQQALE